MAWLVCVRARLKHSSGKEPRVHSTELYVSRMRLRRRTQDCSRVTTADFVARAEDDIEEHDQALKSEGGTTAW